MKIRLAALFASLATVAVANASEHIVWIKDGKHSATHDVAAGKLIEVCGNIAAGERYAWKFDANAKVNFDIHYHVEDLLGKPAVLERVQQGASVFEAKSKQDYCWTWYNRSKEPVKITVQIAKS
ncbi:MAG: hypothetical protein SF172_15800 [Burkholderiales bacterium]|jgi:hypothetical protein|nr:hypothetical protein [Burkholderiales bacterium]